MVPKVRQLTAMNYTRNHHTSLIQFHTMFCAENCVLLSIQSFPCARQRCVNDILFFQRCFNKIIGLLGKIQGLFKDFSRTQTKFSIFKELMLFQGLLKARGNHVQQIYREVVLLSLPLHRWFLSQCLSCKKV